MISAKRKDGTAVQVGDGVVIYLKSGKRHVGRIREVCGTFTFRSRRMATQQIYKVYCDDGALRIVHAWRIKVVFPKKKWTRSANNPNGQAATRLTAAQR